jgi:hypothetical protein
MSAGGTVRSYLRIIAAGLLVTEPELIECILGEFDLILVRIP